MQVHSWFIFDLGNVLIDLAFDRVVSNLCRDSDQPAAEMVRTLEGAGGYRDLERGSVTFQGLHSLLRDQTGYRGGLDTFRAVWTDFFAGITPGMEALLETVRERYRVAFLSNSNEVHAEVIPKMFPELFREGDVMVFSHEHGCAKPDPEMFRKALEIIGAEAAECLYVDDLEANVVAARNAGMTAFHFRGAETFRRELLDQGLI